ncbi:MAG: MtrB/PioB family outer membrane beta-barrel protein, partial [Tepidiformaceae bacterium]
MSRARDARMASLVPFLLVLAVVSTGAEDSQPAEAEVVFGPQYYVSEDQDDAAKFGEYRDVPNGFVAERFRFSWEPRARFFFDVDAYDITQRDQRIGIEFGRIDLWKGTIRWTENPRLWSDQASQLWAHRGAGTFTLEDSFQSAVAAASGAAPVDSDMDGLWDLGASPFNKAAIIQRAAIDGVQPVSLGHQRRVGGVGFEYTPTRHWTFTLDTARERRNGTAPQTLGMTFSFAPAEVAAPYDYRTDWATGTVEY